jgi:hypothetical protein
MVAEAPNAVDAAIWVDALISAGIDARTFERGVGAALGGAATVLARYPVLVPRVALVPSRNLLSDLGGARILSPYKDPETTRHAQRQIVTTAAVAIAAIIAAGLLARLFG